MLEFKSTWNFLQEKININKMNYATAKKLYDVEMKRYIREQKSKMKKCEEQGIDYVPDEEPVMKPVKRTPNPFSKSNKDIINGKMTDEERAYYESTLNKEKVKKEKVEKIMAEYTTTTTTVIIVNEKVIDPIYIKYERIVREASNDYLTNCDYSATMEILRYCEKKIGNELHIDTGCPVCVLQLMKIFISLK